MSIAVCLAAATALACGLTGRGSRWRSSPVDGAAVGWAVALVIAAVFALDRAASLPRLTKALFPFLVGLAAWHARDARVGRRALATLLFSAGLSAIFGVALYTAHGRWFPIRARGPVGHYVTYAGQMSVAAAVGFAVALRARETRWRWLGLGSALCASVALALTYTRGSWIGLALGLALVLALVRPRILVATGAAVALLLLVPSSFRTRLFSSFDTTNALWNGQRLFMWDAGWRMFRDHPVTGVGLQDLHSLYDRYKAAGAWEPAGHLHSVPVQVAATMGVIGLVACLGLYLALALTVGRDLRHRARRRGLAGALALGAAAAFISFAFAGLFEWNLGDEEVLHPLYALVGLAWAARYWDAEPDEKRS
jgi:O-antigen ligase